MSCSSSTFFDSAFSQWRATLPIIETQKYHLVSDVDRRETGLFPRKTKTSLPGSFFFLKKCEPFQLGEADVCQSTGDSTGGRAHGSTAVTIRGLVYEWLDPRHVLELQEACQVLEGAPQSCSARGQHAPAVHQAVLAHGQARCQRRPRCEHRRDLLPPLAGESDRVGPPRRLTSSTCRATLRRPRHSRFSMDRGPLDMLMQMVHAGKTDAVLPEQPRLERTHHVTSQNGWAITATTILQFIATLDTVLNPSKEGHAWILLWDTASIHASEGTMTAMKEKFTSYCASSRHEARRTCSPSTWPSSAASRAGARGLGHGKGVRRRGRRAHARPD